MSGPEVQEVLSYDLSLRTQRATSSARAADDALDAAFDLVNRFRLVLTRADGTVAADVVIEVEPGQDEYDLPVDVEAETPDEVFTVVITALQGDTPLFQSAPTSVSATSGSDGGGAVEVTVAYAGPGVTASSVEIDRAGVVVGPGGSKTLTATVRDAAGNSIGGVPLAWASADAAVATAALDGSVTGAGAGITRVTVTTPTGLSDDALVYVVGGEVAYISSGQVHRGAIGSGTASSVTPSTSGARAPAWGPDGGRLLFAAGGEVREVGGGVRVSGSFPSVSPDGSKLAFQRGARTFFANSDGTNATGGPDGREPAWSGATELVVAGGSIERVDAGTGTRTTVDADGSARLPAVGPGGAVAYVTERGGRTTVVAGGTDVLPADLVAHSRPSWSPDGQWLLVSASRAGFPPTLHVVPSDGGSAPVALDFATTEERDPAWRPPGPAAAPPAVSVTGLTPSRPLPGQEVVVQGTGFDALIPVNNRVFFPGDVEVPVLGVSPGEIRVRAPDDLGTGTLRVQTFTGSGTLGVTPSQGTLQVVARTEWGKGVSGVEVQVRQGSTPMGTRTTPGDGTVTFTNLFTGTYQVDILGVRDGFSAPSSLGSHAVTLDAVTTVNVDVDAEVRDVSVTPTEAELDAPGEETGLKASVRDVDGDEIPTATPEWTSSNEAVVELTTAGLDATAKGAGPGSSTVTVSAGGLSADADVTVKGAVTGSIETTGGKGVSGSAVEAVQSGEVVGEATTDDDGAFRITGLPLGALEVRLAGLREGFEAAAGESGSRAVTITEGGAEPEADFLAKALVQSMEFSTPAVEIPAPGQESTLSVDAVDVDGDPVTDLEVEWTSSDESVVTLTEADDGSVAALTTGTSVKAVALAPGDVSVTAAADGFEVSAAVSVLGGIVGSVDYDHGAPFPGATLLLTRDGSEVATLVSEADGTFEFEGLAVGDYRLSLILEGGFNPVGDPARDVVVATGEAAPEIAFLVDPEAREVTLDLEQDEGEEKELLQGDRFGLAAVVKDARGNDIPNAEVTWESSDDDVIGFEDPEESAVLVGSVRVQIVAVGPGAATVTATVDALTSAPAAFSVKGAVRGTLRLPDGRAFDGATVRLQQAGSDVRDPQVTGADGAFDFPDVDAGEYTLRFELPVGFFVDVPNPLPVTVGPGLDILSIRVLPAVQDVIFDPANPSVTVGNTVEVKATVLDRLGNPITTFNTIRWRSADDHTSAFGTTLTGAITGIRPTDGPGEATVELVLNGRVFQLAVTVTASFTEAVIGDFETGDLTGWGSADAGSGDFLVHGTGSLPFSGQTVPAPLEGSFTAVTDQSGPGSHIIFKGITVPATGTTTLSAKIYVDNRNASYHTPPSLDHTLNPNQQFRVDIMDPTAPLADVGSGVLLNVFRTEVGDPAFIGPMTITADLTPFAGQTVRIRFAEVDNQFFFHAGVDAVTITNGAGGATVQAPPTAPQVEARPFRPPTEEERAKYGNQDGDPGSRPGSL